MDAREPYKAKEVLDVVLPSRNEAAEVVHPCKERFHFPASAVAAQLPSVLSLLSAVKAVGRDHFDAVFVRHLLVQGGRVIGLVADQSFGQQSTQLVRQGTTSVALAKLSWWIAIQV
jgi:hypothetical protein